VWAESRRVPTACDIARSYCRREPRVTARRFGVPAVTLTWRGKETPHSEVLPWLLSSDSCSFSRNGIPLSALLRRVEGEALRQAQGTRNAHRGMATDSGRVVRVNEACISRTTELPRRQSGGDAFAARRPQPPGSERGEDHATRDSRCCVLRARGLLTLSANEFGSCPVHYRGVAQ
jgi:hypothetical protein